LIDARLKRAVDRAVGVPVARIDHRSRRQDRWSGGVRHDRAAQHQRNGGTMSKSPRSRRIARRLYADRNDGCLADGGHGRSGRHAADRQAGAAARRRGDRR
jgi:hypothetical protein